MQEYFKHWTKELSLIEYNLYDWSEEGPLVKDKTITSPDDTESIKTYLVPSS